MNVRSLLRRVDLLSLQLFVAVCETRSIARAAEREFMAASAVSKRLSELEETLGTVLLYRHAKGVDLSPAGQALLQHARGVITGLERMLGDLGEFASGIRGHVRIFANISAIVQFLPRDLPQFLEAHNEVKIDLEEHVTDRVLRGVEDGSADVGICCPLTPPQNLQVAPYRRDRLVVIAQREHPLAQRSSLRFTDTLDYDYVGLHIDSAINSQMRRAAEVSGHTLKMRMHVHSFDAMCAMAENGMGIGVMPDIAVERLGYAQRLAMIPLDETWAQRQLLIVMRDKQLLPPAARALVDHLERLTK